MKLLIISFFISVTACSQNAGAGLIRFTTDTVPLSFISYHPKTGIRIYGDTIAVVKSLLDRVHELEKTNRELLKTSVDFTNQIPDYFRTTKGNCRWEAFSRVLNKNGYKTVKLKKAVAICR